MFLCTAHTAGLPRAPEVVYIVEMRDQTSISLGMLLGAHAAYWFLGVHM